MYNEYEVYCMNIDNNNRFQIGFSSRKIPKKEMVPNLSVKIQNIIDKLEPDSKNAARQLEKIGEKISNSAYLIDEYVLLPVPRHISDIIEDIKQIYMNNNSSILEYVCRKELSPYNDLHIFKLKVVTDKVKKYNKNNVTDSAKRNFYEDMKKLLDSVFCSPSEILDEKNWYMSNDGQKIYNISPHLDGCITRTEYDTTLKMLFDKLFN